MAGRSGVSSPSADRKLLLDRIHQSLLGEVHVTSQRKHTLTIVKICWQSHILLIISFRKPTHRRHETKIIQAWLTQHPTLLSWAFSPTCKASTSTTGIFSNALPEVKGVIFCDSKSTTTNFAQHTDDDRRQTWWNNTITFSLSLVCMCFQLHNAPSSSSFLVALPFSHGLLHFVEIEELGWQQSLVRWKAHHCRGTLVADLLPQHGN